MDCFAEPLIGRAICSIGWIAVAATSPGRPGGYSGHKSTDKRQIADQEQADRELFHEDRARFNVKQRMDYEREQKARDQAREAREAKMSRDEKQERAEGRAAAAKKAEEATEFAETRSKENSHPSQHNSDALKSRFAVRASLMAHDMGQVK